MSKLDWPDVFSLIWLWLALVWMDIRLRLLHHGLNRCFLFSNPAKDEQTWPPLDPMTDAAVERLARLVAVAARFQGPFNLSCLRQALVLRSRLHVLGIPSRLVYGVKKEKSHFAAHAWLEAGGKTINSIPNLKILD
jgi:hypothetical protein